LSLDMLRIGTHIVVILMFIFCAALHAQKTSIKFENLTIDDGLSQSSINCIIQDRQGFVWIGTQDGLNQYEGYHFKVFKNSIDDPNSISNNYIRAVYEDRKGMLWVGTDVGGLNRFDKRSQKFTRVWEGSGLEYALVWAVCEDQEGNIWAGTKKEGLIKYNPKTKKITKYTTSNGLPGNNVRSLLVDSRGNLWVGTAGNGLSVFNAKEESFTTFRASRKGLSDNIILSLAEADDNSIWIGTSNGLNKMTMASEDVTFQAFYSDSLRPLALSHNIINKVYINKEGIWIGTGGKGIDKLVFNEGKAEFYNYQHNESIENSLLNNIIYDIYEDRSGSVWVGTREGIGKFDPSKQGFGHITREINNPNSLNDKNIWFINQDKRGILWIGTREGVTRLDRSINAYRHYPYEGKNQNDKNNNSVLSFIIDKKGAMWAGTVDGLYQFKVSTSLDSAEFIPVKFRDDITPLSDNRVYCLIEDKDNYLWVCTKEGLGRLDPSTGWYQFFQHDPSDPASIGSNIIRYAMQDKEGTIWVATEIGGLNKVIINDDGKRQSIVFKKYKNDPKNPNSIGNDIALSICQGDDDALWVATYGGGLNRFDPETEKFIRYTEHPEKNSIPNNVVYGVLRGEEGTLWMSTNKGISLFNIRTGRFKNYLESDGLQSNEFNTGAYFKGSEGELFFGGINGFNAFRPEAIQNNQNQPQVVLTNILLFNKQVKVKSNSFLKQHISLTKEITLPYNKNNLTIEFAALHYSNPKNNQYRFIMEGFDERTTFAGTERRAHYTNLDPGVYTFKVYGSNSDGVWSRLPATLKITVTPPFWETWWFRMILAFLIVGIVYTIYWVRINSIRAQKVRLENEVVVRTKEVMEQKEKIEFQKKRIEEEKEKSDQLLLNILPEETAEELKAKGKASARNYRRVTVMFTDFIGFTKIAESMRPSALVAKLDGYFIKFDEIIEKREIEKIKTIGDSYMCAGGLPIRNKSNPIDTVLAGLEIQQYMQELKEEALKTGEEYWELRIGVNTGETIAGVIGTKRFAYDIWGNTVNVAARMETSCEAGKVNISGKTFDMIEPYFECTYRGKIPAKNKGEIDMYYVNRIKPELSIDGKGLEPNDAFWDYVNLHLFSSINYMKAERYIMKLLKKKLSPKLHYHGLHHTYDVVESAERIALMEGITGEEMFLLKSAATYHDAGFIEQYDANEPVGVRLAEEILPRYGYTPEQIEVVAGLIHATTIPHDPQNHLQQIICDADLDYLGRDDFHEISDTLRVELREHGKINSDRLWDEIQVKFLNMHQYFTKSAIELRQGKKMEHLEDVKKRLEEDNYVD
jgi:ligand-binding sensor domain-containing protein/class 3 adenylate cyclase/predicted metal-dependent HD superfamily phosphohydrolase